MGSQALALACPSPVHYGLLRIDPVDEEFSLLSFLLSLFFSLHKSAFEIIKYLSKNASNSVITLVSVYFVFFMDFIT